MSTSTDDLVLRLARDKALLSEQQIAAARNLVERNADLPGGAPGLIDILVAQDALDRSAIARLLAGEFGLPYVGLDETSRTAPEALALVPRGTAVRHGLVPLAKNGRTLVVAVGDPTDTEAVDSIAQQHGVVVEAVVAPADQVTRAIERFYGPAPKPLGLSGGMEPAGSPESPTTRSPGAPETGSDSERDMPIVRLVHAIVLEAVRRRASDIHLEPFEKRFRVRYRVDGVLVDGEEPPKRLQAAIVSRVKIMADISIAEKRLPQDGRMQFVQAGRELDLRVSTLPTVHGESVVMRILDKEGLHLGLPELGLAGGDEAQLRRLITLPDGMLLVTGPTGSGKTTTLYGCLHYINRSDRKVITVEDPVEYRLTGINQVPVRPDAGVTFASALRAILRQAPNVVMIGEIRDVETAEIAINASLTGHLVFSTLHTNDAPGAITRLLDIGVKPFLVSGSLRAVLAQRLVRKNCEKCRRPCTPPAPLLRALRLAPEQIEAADFQRGVGCPACLGTGYLGRTGVFELLVVDPEIERAIHAHVSAARLRDLARARGLRTMREDAIAKATAGLTTIEEVVSITVGDSS